MTRRGRPGNVGLPTFTNQADYPSMSNQAGLPAPTGFKRPGGPAFQGGYNFGGGPAGGGASTDPLAFFETGIQSGYEATPGGVALQRAFPGGYFSSDWWGEDVARGRGNYYRYARPFAFQGGYAARPDADRLANRYDGFRGGYERDLAREVSPMNVYPRPDFPSGYTSNRSYAGTAQGYLAEGYHESPPVDFHFQPLESGAMVFQCGSAKAHLRPSSCGYPRTLEITNFDCGNLVDCVEFLRVGLDIFGGLQVSPEFDGAANALQNAIGVFVEGNDMTAAGRPVVADICPQLQVVFGPSPLAYVLMTADVAAGSPMAGSGVFATAQGHMPGPGGPGRPFRSPAYVVGAAPQMQGLMTTQELLSALVNNAGGGDTSLEVVRYADSGEPVPHLFAYDAQTQMFSHGPKDSLSTTLTGEAIVNLYGPQPMWANGEAPGQPQQVAGPMMATGQPEGQELYVDKDGEPLNQGDSVKFAIEVEGTRRTGKGRIAELDNGLVKIRTTKNYKRPQGKGRKSDLEVTFPVSQEGVAYLPSDKKNRDLYVAISD